MDRGKVLLLIGPRQVGSEVSFNELGKLLGIDVQTVQRYVDLLEKVYVIFHLRSYSRNVRNELKKSVKIYFYDNGVRNAVLSNFSPWELRSDTGSLWENFLISQRIKNNLYHNRSRKYYFWRTTQRQEIDFIEEAENQLFAYEFKYSDKKAGSKCPLTFSNNYPDVPFSVVTWDNYIGFCNGAVMWLDGGGWFNQRKAFLILRIVAGAGCVSSSFFCSFFGTQRIFVPKNSGR